jgi:hypothetical protein
MLYESTKNLLQSILRSLEAGDETRWDDRTESGNACLYEMHQMSGPLYKAYRPDTLHANSLAQTSLPGMLNRAMPHVRLMVIAIRHKDQTRALESGKAALAEMNGMGVASPPDSSTAQRTKSQEATVPPPIEGAHGAHGLLVEPPRRIRVSSGKRRCE